MVGVEEGREFRFRGDLYSQESTFPLVVTGVADVAGSGLDTASACCIVALEAAWPTERYGHRPEGADDSTGI